MKKQLHQIGIWLDGHQAIIVSFEHGKTTIQRIDAHNEEVYFKEGEPIKGEVVGRHNDHEATIHHREQNAERKYIKQVYESIQNADELYIIGPAEIKSRLKHFIEDEHKHDAHKIKAVDSCDYLREGQIIEKIKAFFRLS